MSETWGTELEAFQKYAPEVRSMELGTAYVYYYGLTLSSGYETEGSRTYGDSYGRITVFGKFYNTKTMRLLVGLPSYRRSKHFESQQCDRLISLFVINFVSLSGVREHWVLKPATKRGLVFYDILTTLSDEVDYIWRRKFSSVTLLFLLNRHALLVLALLQVYSDFGFATTSALAPSADITLSMRTTTSCSVALNLTSALQMLLIVIQSGTRERHSTHKCGSRGGLTTLSKIAFIAIRVYALSGGRWLISIISLIFGVTGVFSYMYLTPGPQPVLNLLGIPFRQCASSDYIWTSNKFKRSLLLESLAVMSTIMNFQTPLQAIIVSHFLLDIRGAAHGDAFSISDEQQGEPGSQQSSMRFVSFVAPMGGSLDIGSHGNLDGDEYEAEEEGRENETIELEDAIRNASLRPVQYFSRTARLAIQLHSHHVKNRFSDVQLSPTLDHMSTMRKGLMCKAGHARYLYAVWQRARRVRRGGSKDAGKPRKAGQRRQSQHDIFLMIDYLGETQTWEAQLWDALNKAAELFLSAASAYLASPRAETRNGGQLTRRASSPLGGPAVLPVVLCASREKLTVFWGPTEDDFLYSDLDRMAWAEMGVVLVRLVVGVGRVEL
ncbi:hypothetical protein CERSUDRAFT_75524 [Gelatoporia subvermispora B]|uniref:DUF6533 domain-containing protein n=1 Tax=Ceriporiopsis subvermispora (strain B) TaxID=914234 RepID=M2PF73_CERS8|nr:hypothetical protein CERSUDRAFT_75524 [Gelatoporia subvermispora B]